MKRAMSWYLTMATATTLVLAACKPAAESPAVSAPEAIASSDWSQTPVIEEVRTTDREIQLSGSAQPGARVVLRSAGGAAYAAVANAERLFEIRMDAPTSDLWLRPETQVGQNAMTSPGTLLIPAGGTGPFAVLRPGGPTRRLDQAPALAAIDSDSQARRLSGRTTAGNQTLSILVGDVSMQVFPDAAGYWDVVLGPEAAGNQIVIGDQTFIWPGSAETRLGQAPIRERAGQGWRIVWSEAGAVQTVWLPDAG